LAFAAAFTLVLNFALVTTFVWPRLVTRDWPSWASPTAAWVLVLWFWVVGRRGSGHLLHQEAAKSLQPDAASDELFCEAQVAYLKGHWLEAETRLLKLLARRPGDAEARLMLASVYRRSGQQDKARWQLNELAQLSSAVGWQEERIHETQLLSRSKAQAGVEISGGPSVFDQRRAA
jgi:hypothetical protein